MPQVPTSRARWRAEWIAFALVVALGVFVRLWHLQYPACWVDESESCINALTILEHGVPVDRYQGQPIYENCLVEATPADPEYEFRDSSYSSKGLAVYHGWLPLYSIAASMWCFGVRPDPIPEPLRVVHDFAEQQLRTIAARLPSVLFGALFLVVLVVASRAMYGSDMAWVAVLIGGFAAPCVRYAREARYYSATLALTTLTCWAIFEFVRRGRARDMLFAGFSFALLFHTHVLSFAIACCVLALAAPFAIRESGWQRRWLLFAVIVLASTLPWIAFTGFFAQAGKPPKAWPMLSFPRDVLIYPIEKLPYLAPLALGVAAMFAARDRRRWPKRFVDAFGAHGGVGFLLALWLVVGYAAFVALTPAASFFVQRATIPLAGPGILLAALCVAALARTCLGAHSRYAAPVCAAALVPLCGSGTMYWLRYTTAPSNAQIAIDELRARGTFAAGTRFFATPNEHLNLSFYSGLPVQSIAPVRRSFLDRADLPVVFVDATVAFEPLTVDEVLRVARANGAELDAAAAKRWRDALWSRPALEKAVNAGAVLDEPLGELPAFARACVARQRELAPSIVVRRRDPADDNPPIFRGFVLRDWSDWWLVFFLRFVDPLARSGEHANYAERLHGARAKVLVNTWTIYDSPPRPPRVDPGH